MSDEVHWNVDLEKEPLSIAYLFMAAECPVLHISARIHKDEGYTVLQTPNVTLFLLSNLACFFLQKTEVEGVIKKAMQENQMLLS